MTRTQQITTVNLRELRRSRGLTLERLAAQSHVSLNWIGAVEREPALMTPRVARLLGSVLGIDPAQLMAARGCVK